MCSVQYRNTSECEYQSKRLPDCVVQYKTTIISLLLKYIHVKSYLKTCFTLFFGVQMFPNTMKIRINYYQTYFKCFFVFFSATTEDLPMKDLKRLFIGYNLQPPFD